MRLSTLIFLAAITSTQIHAAPSTANAAPFGLEIGVATCDAVKAMFQKPKERPAENGDIWLMASNSSDLYPGSTHVGARCSQNKLIGIVIKASKGGMESDAAQQAYATLSSKYKRVAGAPMPTLGDGYARFVAGNTVIEQDTPHLSFEFTVTYLEKGLYESIAASNTKEKQQTSNKKQSAL